LKTEQQEIETMVKMKSDKNFTYHAKYRSNCTVLP